MQQPPAMGRVHLSTRFFFCPTDKTEYFGRSVRLSADPFGAAEKEGLAGESINDDFNLSQL